MANEFYSKISFEALIAMHLNENERINRENAKETQDAIEAEIQRRIDEVFSILHSTEQIKQTLKRKSPRQCAKNIIHMTVNAGCNDQN